MIKGCFTLFLLAIILSLEAQPGGGGGVRIQVILDKNNKPIPAGDTNLIVKTFLLSGEDNPVVTKEYTDRDRDRSYRYIGRESTRYYVPPYLWGKGGKIPAPDQCVEFIYKGDTTVVELLGISAGNAIGSAERMDTVKLWPSYYNRFYRTASKRFAIVRQQERNKAVDESDKAYQLMCNGITDSAATSLYHFGMLEQRSPVKQVIYDRGNHYDTFPSYRMPLYKLPFANISYRKDSSVAISTPGVPLLENKEHLYRFVLDYVPVSILAYSAAERSEAVQLNLQISRFARSLRNYPVIINGQPYTGILKIFYPFIGIGIDRNAGGYHLDVMRYKNGRLTEINSYDDVDTDDELSHPRLTMK